jgi:hypothetical protein
MSKKNRRPVHHPPARTDTFNPDYSDVKRDLKRIGILAGVFILALVILSLFQEQLLALIVR